MSGFVARDWYWIVAGSTTQVYSSARAAYVPISDTAYTAWLGGGGKPTRILSEAELWDVLATAYPAGIATSGQDRLKDNRIGAFDMTLLRIAFNHENRLRALEGKQAITLQQFATAVKALL